MMVDIDDAIVNDVDMALEELLDIYWLKIDKMESVLKTWRDKIKNYGVKKDNVLHTGSRKVNKKKVRVYPRQVLKDGYSISELDELREYSWNMRQFGGMFREELRESTATYIIRILRCDDEELLENIKEIEDDCPCRELYFIWKDIKNYLDLRIKMIKLESLRNELTRDHSKENGHQKVLNKQKPEAL